ncbi:hypothetical protein HYG77_17135 [Rhodococcus sp. ZPP]|nr:hypothetical protein HYG77_17135 [Rhodococcus sp. ZPP]
MQSDPGVELPVAAALFEGNGLAVSLVSPLHVYPSGLYLWIQWDLQRSAANFDAIQSVLHDLTKARRIETPTEQLPTIEIDYGNDRVLSTQRRRPEPEDRPPTVDTALLFYKNAGWMKNDNGGYQYRSPLWAWPLPPPHALTLTVDWPTIGLHCTPARLDGANIVSAMTE